MVPPAVKFCGLTRTEDAAEAVAAGAAFVGVIFAGGPRLLDAGRASEVLEAVPPGVLRVGVFGGQPLDEIAAISERLGLAIVQLHGDPTPLDVQRARAATGRGIWAAARVEGDTLPLGLADLFAVADAVVLDAKVPGQLGGTGVRVPWADVAARVAAARGAGRLVLAGGLTPENVAEAVRAIVPDIVDVSSGVESSPGIKDHQRLRAFQAAVASTAESHE